MRRVLLFIAWVGLLTSLSAGCVDAGERASPVPEGADGSAPAVGADEEASVSIAGATDPEGEVGDAEGYCLSLTRTAAAIASGSPVTAQEAAEEALARAPDELIDATMAITEALRGDEDGDRLSEPGLDDAVARLLEAAGDVCAPR